MLQTQNTQLYYSPDREWRCATSSPSCPAYSPEKAWRPHFFFDRLVLSRSLAIAPTSYGFIGSDIHVTPKNPGEGL